MCTRRIDGERADDGVAVKDTFFIVSSFLVLLRFWEKLEK
jgi:hypothetical protein